MNQHKTNLPKITSLNYFECEKDSCASTIEAFEKNKIYTMNCVFIEVSNEVYSDEIFIINDHLNVKPEKPIEGVNMWSSENFFTVGFWHVKYK